jgi:hypothetical protein
MFLLIGFVLKCSAYLAWRLKRIEWLLWVLSAMGWVCLGIYSFNTAQLASIGAFCFAGVYLWRATRRYGTNGFKKPRPKQTEDSIE